MKLQIERTYVESLAAKFPELESLTEQLKFKAIIPFHHFSTQYLDYLQSLYESAGDKMQGQAAQISTLKQALIYDGKRFEEGELEALVPALAEFLIKDAICGWLFKAAERLLLLNNAT